MNNLPVIRDLRRLDERQIRIHVLAQDNPTVGGKVYSGIVRWFASNDNANWKSFNGSEWADVPADVVADPWLSDGMSYSLINSLTLGPWMGLAGDRKQIFLRAVLVSSYSGDMPIIEDVVCSFPPKRKVGSYIVVCQDSTAVDTATWVRLVRAVGVIGQPDNTDIRFAFRNETNNEWRAWNGTTWISFTNERDIFTRGMTNTTMVSLNHTHWAQILSKKLYVLMGLRSDNRQYAPYIRNVKLEYIDIDNPSVSNTITIRTPSRQHFVMEYDEIVEYAYNELLYEGFGFLVENTNDDFYTIPNRILIKPLNMGTVLGAKDSTCHPFEVINTWRSRSFNITLRVRQGNEFAQGMTNYCLLPDSEQQDFRTRVSMAFNMDLVDIDGVNTGVLQSPLYPINFPLGPLQKRLLYLQVNPILVGRGQQRFYVTLDASPV
jgi:hypothetical protein